MTTDVPLLIVIVVSFAFASWVMFESQRIARKAIRSAETSYNLTDQAITVAHEAIILATSAQDRVDALLDLLGRKDADDLR